MPYKLSIPGQVSEFQLRAIEAVAGLVPEGGTAVEIGSLFGRSSYGWGKSIPQSARLFCIDPWAKNEGVRPMEERLGIKYSIEQFKIFTAECTNITAIQGYSPRDVRDWNQPLDLFYEDSVHQNPVLAENLQFWSSHLKPTGLACGDDFRPRFPDVMNGATELGKKLGREVLVVDKFWCLLPPESLVPGAAAVREKLLAISAEAQADALTRPRANTFSIRQTAGIKAGEDLKLDYLLCNESPLTWEHKGEPLFARIEISLGPVGAKRAELAVIRLPGPLLPDLPMRGEDSVPTTSLAAGRYSAAAQVVLANASDTYRETLKALDWVLEVA
jgi:hypothetical protein